MNDKDRRRRGPDQGNNYPCDPHAQTGIKPSRLQRKQKRGWKRGRK